MVTLILQPFNLQEYPVVSIGQGVDGVQSHYGRDGEPNTDRPVPCRSHSVFFSRTELRESSQLYKTINLSQNKALFNFVSISREYGHLHPIPLELKSLISHFHLLLKCTKYKLFKIIVTFLEPLRVVKLNTDGPGSITHGRDDKYLQNSNWTVILESHIARIGDMRKTQCFCRKT